MKSSLRLLCLSIWLMAGTTHAQIAESSGTAGTPTTSALTGELMYQLLLGELNARGGEPGTGFALMLDAARKTDDPQLYQRAIEIALSSRMGEEALLAARNWKQSQPNSRDANRYLLQILIALNRTRDTLEPLKAELARVDAKDRALAISVIPRNYARVGDRKLAAAVVEQALADYTGNAATASAAWTVIGRMRLAAADSVGALDAARRGQTIDVTAAGPALLALDLMDPKLPEAELVVRRYLEGKPAPEVRMGYARALLDAQRYAEASEQLVRVTTDKPDFVEAWLVLGTLQLQDNQLASAQTSLERYVKLAKTDDEDDAPRGLSQAYLSLAQISEKRKDFAAAEAWLNKIQNSQELVSAQSRRASILARQGKVNEARALIRELPERKPGDARMKLTAEVQLLRDNKQYQPAYDLLQKALEADPKDGDLLYDQAMLAEKLGRLDEMERLLRQLMQAKPEYHHAYNALGYSLAERGVRLTEARQLIQKALEYAPGDPFISDSLGWVEFRMGNHAEALRILDTAYKTKPDSEIAAHLGEVLWVMGQRERATRIWREGLLLNNENETLLETLKRLRVKL